MSIPPRKEIPVTPAIAREHGRQAGAANKHHCSHDYTRPELWIAWLGGWRDGQREYVDGRRAEFRETYGIEVPDSLIRMAS